MDRRAFIRATGVLLGTFGAGKLLVACGNGSGIPGGDPTWNLIRASFPEMLVGEQQRVAFGLTTLENVPVEEADVEVYTRTPGGDVTGGPYAVELHADGALGLPLYLTRVDIPDPGALEIVAVSGRDHGASTVNVVRPEDSQAPAPGDEAIATRTPTLDDALGYEEICTRQPDCPLHDASLDDVLAAAQPLLVLFATPAYCQTAVCGPAVDTFLAVRDDRDWGDLAFLHVEIFTDAGVTVGGPVRDWELPSEPWLFAIDRDGTIVERVDGPMLHSELVGIADGLA
jgi:hypothetical protein